MKRYSCHMVAEDAAPNIVCTSPEEVARFCKDVLCLHESPQELVYVFYLNTKGGFVGYELVAKGGISDALVYPRDIFRGAIVLNAASIIMVHSHPSGDPTPSKIDEDLTSVFQNAEICLESDFLIISSSESRISVSGKRAGHR